MKDNISSCIAFFLNMFVVTVLDNRWVKTTDYPPENPA